MGSQPTHIPQNLTEVQLFTNFSNDSYDPTVGGGLRGPNGLLCGLERLLRRFGAGDALLGAEVRQSGGNGGQPEIVLDQLALGAALHQRHSRENRARKVLPCPVHQLTGPLRVRGGPAEIVAVPPLGDLPAGNRLRCVQD